MAVRFWEARQSKFLVKGVTQMLFFVCFFLVLIAGSLMLVDVVFSGCRILTPSAFAENQTCILIQINKQKINFDNFFYFHVKVITNTQYKRKNKLTKKNIIYINIWQLIYINSIKVSNKVSTQTCVEGNTGWNIDVLLSPNAKLYCK